MIQKIKQNIPNALTLLNLLCGLLAIICLFSNKIEFIFVLIGISLLADFLDGLVARALHVKSEIGADLDSLADMVSFGVLPGLVLVQLIINAITGSPSMSLIFQDEFIDSKILAIFPLVVTLFSALRLAIFNNATDQSHDFKGLATPASTIFVLGLLIIDQIRWAGFVFHFKPWHILIVSIALSFLLVSKVRMFSFKLTSSKLKDNLHLLIFLVGVIVLLLLFKLAAVSFIIVWYVVFNIGRNLITKQ